MLHPVTPHQTASPGQADASSFVTVCGFRSWGHEGWTVQQGPFTQQPLGKEPRGLSTGGVGWGGRSFLLAPTRWAWKWVGSLDSQLASTLLY